MYFMGEYIMTKAFQLLKKDHEKVTGIIDELMLTSAHAKVKRQNLLNLLKDNLKLHETIEEKLLYPALEKKRETKDLTLEAYQEHHILDVLLEELEHTDFEDDAWKAKLTVLQENLLHHIVEEEKQLFPDANKVLTKNQLDNLADGIQDMKANKT